MKLMIAVGLAAILIGFASETLAESAALERLREYIQIDTTNPPGNEVRGVEFFRRIFEQAGVQYETAEPAPGRGNIWARLHGGTEPALILLHHMDVVPATAATWETDPLSAIVRNGMLFGRGALDAKSLGIMHLQAFLSLHENDQPLTRDVIFMATADEEAGGLLGAGWLIENRPELFTNVGYLLNEGGRGIRAGDQVSFRIEVAQKRPYWLRLIATDQPGHGSSPQLTSATTRLIAALQRIHQSPFEPRVVPQVRDMFVQLSPQAEPIWRDALRDIDQAIQDPDFLARFQAAKPGLHALLRNTCSITVLNASQKINVVSPLASAELDCRILPDQDAADFLNALRERVNDDHIQIEEIMLFGPAQSSTDTDLYRLLQRVTNKHHPNAGIVNAVLTGFTDSHFFRDLNIVSYGYAPVIVSEAMSASVHGNNERIGVDAFNRGVEIMTEIVASFATK